MKTGSAQINTEGERRLVTALFADMVGFTPISESLDPEETLELLEGMYTFIDEIIKNYEGTVTQLAADGTMAVFGAPVAHVNDPQRAVLAALDMQKKAAEYAVFVKDEYDVDFKLRIGLNTGLVIAGSIGVEGKKSFTAIGDAANVASRIESIAQPDTVYISENTWRLVRDHFEMHEVGQVELKGVSKPVKTFRVICPKNKTLARDDTVCLIGREFELARLLKLFEDAGNCKGSLSVIRGEAGVGKTRLLHDALQRYEKTDPDVLILRGTGVSHRQNAPYFSIRQALAPMIGLGVPESPEQVTTLVENWMRDLEFLYPEEVRKRLVEVFLLGTPFHETASISEAPVDAKGFTIQALSWVFEALAKKRTLLFVLDDIQWLDELSLETLKGVCSHLWQTRLAVLCTARRDMKPWKSEFLEKLHPTLTFLEITALQNSECKELVRAFFGNFDMPAMVMDTIYERSAGNPFFIEEILHRMVEDRVIRFDKAKGWQMTDPTCELNIPDSIHAAVVARIDSLPADARTFLYYASVAGHSVELRLMESLFPDLDLSETITLCQSRQILRLQAESAKTRIEFKHAITRQVLYDSLLKRRRTEIHGEVGTCLEEILNQGYFVNTETLVYHFEQAGQWRKVMKYAQIAGDNMAAISANLDALNYYETWLKAAGKTSLGDVVAIATVQLKAGDICEILGKYDEATEYYDWTLAALKRKSISDDRTALLTAMAMRKKGRIFERHGNAKDSIALLQGALDMVSSLGAPESRLIRAEILQNLGWRKYLSGDYQGAIGLYQQGVAFIEDLPDNKAHGLLNNGLGAAYLEVGDLEKALGYLTKNLSIRKSIGDKRGEATALVNLGALYYMKGDFDSSREKYNEALDAKKRISEQEGVGISLTNLAILDAETGQLDEAKQRTQKAMEIFLKIGSRWPLPECYILLSNVALNMGDLDIAREMADAGIEVSKELGSMLYEARSKNALAEVAAKNGEWEQAFDGFSWACETLEKKGVAFELAGCCLSFGRCLIDFAEKTDNRDTKPLEQAVERVEKSLEIFARYDNRFYIEKARIELDRAEKTMSRKSP